MSFDPEFLSNLLLILTGFGGAFLAALWVALVVWTYRDIRNRARDRLVHILAPLLVAVLNLPGVLVYLILRPQRTLEEEYQRTLEEEALLQEIEDQLLCPGCERRVKDDWQVCPNCQTKLRKACHACGKLMELPWNICPYCATPVPGIRREGMTMDEVLRGLPVETFPGGTLEGTSQPDLEDDSEGDIEYPYVDEQKKTRNQDEPPN
jgi:RNA polymerase subunit RPABC4/transcription elongation factor Spt4